MALTGQEHKTYVQFAREATYGTKPTITHLLACTQAHARPLVGKNKARNLTGNINRAAITNIGEMALLTLEFDLCYTGQLYILDGLLGTATYGSNGGATTGANPYTHIFREEDLFNSYSFEVIRGNVPSGKCELVTGAKLDTATIRWVASLDGDDAKGRATLNYIGRRFQTDQTPASGLSFPTYDPVIFHHAGAGTVDDGSGDTAADIVVSEFEVSIDNKLARDFGMNSTSGQYLIEPQRDDRPETMFKMTAEFRSKTLMDSYIAGTESSPGMRFVSGSKEALFDMGKAYLMTHEKPPRGAGKIRQEFEWHPIDDAVSAGNNTGLKITIINAQATITT